MINGNKLWLTACCSFERKGVLYSNRTPEEGQGSKRTLNLTKIYHPSAILCIRPDKPTSSKPTSSTGSTSSNPIRLQRGLSTFNYLIFLIFFRADNLPQLVQPKPTYHPQVLYPISSPHSSILSRVRTHEYSFPRKCV